MGEKMRNTKHTMRKQKSLFSNKKNKKGWGKFNGGMRGQPCWIG
jgi:hypothetical protein